MPGAQVNKSLALCNCAVDAVLRLLFTSPKRTGIPELYVHCPVALPKRATGQVPLLLGNAAPESHQVGLLPLCSCCRSGLDCTAPDWHFPASSTPSHPQQEAPHTLHLSQWTDRIANHRRAVFSRFFPSCFAAGCLPSYSSSFCPNEACSALHCLLSRLTLHLFCAHQSARLSKYYRLPPPPPLLRPRLGLLIPLSTGKHFTPDSLAGLSSSQLFSTEPASVISETARCHPRHIASSLPRPKVPASPTLHLPLHHPRKLIPARLS